MCAALDGQTLSAAGAHKEDRGRERRQQGVMHSCGAPHHTPCRLYLRDGGGAFVSTRRYALQQGKAKAREWGSPQERTDARRAHTTGCTTTESRKENTHTHARQ